MSDTKDQPFSTFVARILSSDTGLIALLPIASYLLIYVFCSGYFGVFTIPLQFIAFDLIYVFGTIAIVLGAAFTVYYILHLATVFIGLFPDPIPAMLKRIIEITIISFFMLFTFGKPPLLDGWIWIVLVAFLSIAIPEFVIPIIRFRGSYLERLSLSHKDAEDRRRWRRKEQNATGSLDKLVAFLGRDISLGIFLLFAVYALGRYSAFTQKSFLISDQDPESVVLFLTSDRAVLARFSRDDGSVIPVFEVLSLTSEQGFSFTREEIGPLRLGEASFAPVVTPSATLFKPPTPTPTSVPVSFPTLVSTSTPSPSETTKPVVNGTPTAEETNGR